MSNDRILFIHEDRIFSNLYREKLEGSGFIVDVSKVSEQAAKIAELKQPQLIIMDVVTPSADAISFIGTIRSIPECTAVPILIMPCSAANICAAALSAGATTIIAKNKRQIAHVVDAAKLALGKEGLGLAMNTNLFDPDDEWLLTINSAIHESVNQMRHCLPALSSTPPDPAALRALWSIAHSFAARAEILPDGSLAQVATAFEILMSDLNLIPEEINPSTLRTIGQATDFLGQMGTFSGDARKATASNARILIVDDEESARTFIGEAMRLAGLSSDSAATPSAAMEKLQGKPADLIFLDVGMPEMNGFELCQKIRTLPEHQKTPIVFLTGMATFQNKAQASLSGGNDFIGKPFNLAELAVKAMMWVFRGRMGIS